MEVENKIIPAEIYSLKKWIPNTDPTSLKEIYQEFLEYAGFKILKYDSHTFENGGFTCFWLLAESHLAIHTFPESNKTYLELSSCNEEKLKRFESKMK